MILTSAIINQKQLVKPTCGCKKEGSKIIPPSPEIPENQSVLSTLMKRVNG